jgi:hypothetical protein
MGEQQMLGSNRNTFIETEIILKANLIINILNWLIHLWVNIIKNLIDYCLGENEAA